MFESRKTISILIASIATVVAPACASANVIAQYKFDTWNTASSINDTDAVHTTDQIVPDISGNGRDLDVYYHTDYASLQDDDPFDLDQSKSIHYRKNPVTAKVENVDQIDMDALTLEGWVKLGSYKAANVLRLRSNAGGTTQIYLGVGDNGHVVGRVYLHGGGTGQFDTGVTVAKDTWTHMAMAYDPFQNSGAARIYVDGTLIDTENVGRTMPSYINNIDSRVAENQYSYADINMDDLRVSDEALSDAELGYYGSFTSVPEPAPLTLLGLGSLGLIIRRRQQKAY